MLKKIAKENILRVLLEETIGSESIKKVCELSKHTIVPDVINSDLNEYFIDSLKDLEDEGLVNIHDKKISITDKGRIEAEKIFTKHSTIEEFFLSDHDGTDPHRIADILEHFISKEVIENMKQITNLESYGIPLNDLCLGEGIITELNISDSQLFERLVSMGVCPGQKIKIIARFAFGMVIKLNNIQIAVDNRICKRILVMGA